MTTIVLALYLASALPVSPAARVGSPLVAAAQAPKAATPAQTQTVNVNTASQQQLEALPGIGPSTAKRIVAYRDKNGPFKKLEDLMNVQGIGEKSFLKLRPHLTLGPGGDAKPPQQ